MTILPSSSSPPVLANGLISGLNTPQIIQAMLARYQQPETDLQNQQATINANVGDYQQINADLLSLQTTAASLATSSGWGARSASSSDTAVATATADPGTPLGTVQFVVKALASANSLVSTGTVASPTNVVDSAPGFLLSQGGGQLGLATLAGSSGLTLGAHTVAVTQASQAGSTTGTVSLGSQSSGIAVAPGADTLSVAVDGTTYNLAIADAPGGGYSGSGLLTAVQNAISAAGAGGVLQAGFDAAGHLQLSTTAQGSSQSLQVTGGTALGVLGLSTMGSASNGVDGVVTVDGTATTLSNVAAGGTITLNAPAGTITATLATPGTANGSILSVGSLTATNISTGNGSLNDLVANVNAVGTGITAAAVQTGPNQYVLQLSSTTTGAASDLSVDTHAFGGSPLGTMTTASAGTDAQIQVGGAGGYTLSSATDTFTGLLPGLSVTVAQTSSSPVTVSVGSDATTVAGSVKSLVDAANTVLSDLQQYAGYNEQTKHGGPLMGSGVLGSLQQAVLSIFGSNEGSSTLGNAKNVGISLDQGKLTFDQSAFETAFSAHPSQVAALFTQGGSYAPSPAGSPGLVSLSYAGTTTKAGTYDVTVTHSATQATSLGTSLAGGTVSAGETLTIAMGGQSLSYTTTAGQSLASIAAGLNQVLAAAGVGVSAATVAGGTQLQLVSASYGSAQQFSVKSSNTAAGTTGLAGATAGTATTFTGTDVAGTINGVAATGSGQYLSAPATDPILGGLSLRVAATGITSSTDLGSFTYTPGVAQAVASLAGTMADPVTGEITRTITGLQTQSTGLNTQISFYAQIVAQQQKLLMAQFASLESQLGALKNQSSELASQLSKLP
jgi:flagellar hook-associated protein 2